MAQMDGQQAAALVIVALAAGSIIRRLAAQIRGFRKDSDAKAGCSGCPSSGPAKADTPANLVQIQTRPPVRLRRPTEEP